MVASTIVGVGLSFAPVSFGPLFVVMGIGIVAAKLALGLYPAIGVSAYVEMRKTTIATVMVVGGFILAGSLIEKSRRRLGDVRTRISAIIEEWE